MRASVVTGDVSPAYDATREMPATMTPKGRLRVDVAVTPFSASNNPNPNANPDTVYADQQVVSATATALTAQVLANGVIVKAKTTNAGSVFVGGAGVTTTNDGTGSGYALAPGEALNIPVTNASAVFIVGTAADIVYVIGN